jgi:hypothetical protein
MVQLVVLVVVALVVELGAGLTTRLQVVGAVLKMKDQMALMAAVVALAVQRQALMVV